jgi:hypothetical protein
VTGALRESSPRIRRACTGIRTAISRFRRKSIPGLSEPCFIAIAREYRATPHPTSGELIMNANSNWKRAPRRCALVLALGSLASLSAGPAMAGCGLYNPAVPPAQRVAPMQEGPKLIAAVYRPGAEGFIPVGHETSVPNSGIVGLWMVSFVSDGMPPNPVPAGVIVDFGTVQWHDDGTELMISGGRAPSEGDVCMGVWEQIGPFTYKLKHLALAWVSEDTPPSMGGPGPSPAQFLGPATISEAVTLNKSRASYQGPFTIDQYNADQSQLLVHISGTVTGTRITVD